jgi:hypothetical protein
MLHKFTTQGILQKPYQTVRAFGRHILCVSSRFFVASRFTPLESLAIYGVDDIDK